MERRAVWLSARDCLAEARAAVADCSSASSAAIRPGASAIALLATAARLSMSCSWISRSRSGSISCFPTVNCQLSTANFKFKLVGPPGFEPGTNQL